MPKQPSSTARLEARLPAEVHALLKRAAEIEGRTLTDFVVSAAQEAARRTIAEQEVMRLILEDQKLFAATLLEPREASPGLRKAVKKHRRLIGPA
jgi:uncharacterized protein (DUF1778 family)